MPTNEQKQVIVSRSLGLRVVNDGDEVGSGSLYYLVPEDGWNTWPAELLRSCQIIAAASRPNKRIYLLAGVQKVVSGRFNEHGGPSLEYGRLCTDPEQVDYASLYGNETAEQVRDWVIARITALVPTAVAVQTAEGLQAAPTSAFSKCCAAISYLFRCCSPKDDLPDLT